MTLQSALIYCSWVVVKKVMVRQTVRRLIPMRYATFIGLGLVVWLGVMTGCQLGDRVETPNLPPYTFIEEGFPNEGQTWLSNAVAFRFFGADPDNEVMAFYTQLVPALIETVAATGQIDTLWPGEAGYYDPTPDSIPSYFDWERTEQENKSYQGVADALYRFSVKAVDEADAEDPRPARRHFLILAATWPEIRIDHCPDPREANPREYFLFHGELGDLEPYQFEYSWMLTGEAPNDQLYHTWQDPWESRTEVNYSGLEPGNTYIWRVRCRVERADTYIESRGFAECRFTIRQ